MLVNSLMEKYPQVDVSVFIGGEQVGINPKINNLQPGYNAAKYELVLISDSGIRSKRLGPPEHCLVYSYCCFGFAFRFAVKEDTLTDMIHHMDDNVGLVHQMPFVCDRDGFPATLEKVVISIYPIISVFPFPFSSTVETGLLWHGSRAHLLSGRSVERQLSDRHVNGDAQESNRWRRRIESFRLLLGRRLLSGQINYGQWMEDSH